MFASFAMAYMSQRLLAVIGWIFLQTISTTIAHAQGTNVKETLDLIDNTADRICYVIIDKGTASGTEVTGAINTQLGHLALHLLDVGVKGTGDIADKTYQNVLRKILQKLYGIVLDAS